MPKTHRISSVFIYQKRIYPKFLPSCGDTYRFALRQNTVFCAEKYDIPKLTTAQRFTMPTQTIAISFSQIGSSGQTFRKRLFLIFTVISVNKRQFLAVPQYCLNEWICILEFVSFALIAMRDDVVADSPINPRTPLSAPEI